MKPLILFFLLSLSLQCFAAVEAHKFANAEQEAAYDTLTSQLRCLVCQNQTIADSNAELAADLRRQVYEMLQQGKSSEEIVQFMTDRYGDFVLYKPPFKAKTGFLWLGPVLFLLAGLVTMMLIIKRRKSVQATAETDAERNEKLAKVKSLLLTDEPAEQEKSS